MNYDNEAIVRNAYHMAEGNVLDIPGWIASFTEDGVFNNVTGEESYRGEHLKDVVKVADKQRRYAVGHNGVTVGSNA